MNYIDKEIHDHIKSNSKTADENSINPNRVASSSSPKGSLPRESLLVIDELI